MNSNDKSSPEDDPALRETLKRCSPATYYAACKFRKTGREEDLRTAMLGVVERFVDRDRQPALHSAGGGLRLKEDLGIDSLTMIEIVMLAEEVIDIPISNEELTHLRTLAEVQGFIATKVAASAKPGRSHAGDDATASPLARLGQTLHPFDPRHDAADPVS